jgi:hypothetical protein
LVPKTKHQGLPDYKKKSHGDFASKEKQGGAMVLRCQSFAILVNPAHRGPGF